MRALVLEQQGANARRLHHWANFLLNIGDGTQPTDRRGDVQLPDYLQCSDNSLQGLITTMYSDIPTLDTNSTQYAQYLTSRAILAPRNVEVDAINSSITDLLHASTPVRKYYSADNVDEESQHLYPTEFLNHLLPSGLPPHELHLKQDVPIILLRNLSGGLANGTRLQIKRLGDDVLDALVLTGPAAGQRVLIPRLTLQPSDEHSLPFHLQRHQYPVRPAFALTINKAQGQTLEHVGVYLQTPVFSHGQLYGALSRGGNPDKVWAVVPDGLRVGTDGRPHLFTRNVVFTEALV
jgi:ATP-dependent DNA helicase PIF1